MILRPRRLADTLAANALSEREKFQYLILWAVAGTLLSAGVGVGEAWTWSRVASLSLLATVTVAGLVMCFQVNARGDNHAFLERYLCDLTPEAVPVVMSGSRGERVTSCSPSGRA